MTTQADPPTTGRDPQDNWVVGEVNHANRLLAQLENDLRQLDDFVFGTLVRKILDYPLDKRQKATSAKVQRLAHIFASPHFPVASGRLIVAWQEIVQIWWSIAEEYRPYAEAFVNKNHSRNSHLDDLRSEAQIGVYRAAQLFDPAREVPFRNYATMCIRRAIHQYLVKQRKHVEVAFTSAEPKSWMGEAGGDTDVGLMPMNHVWGSVQSGFATIDMVDKSLESNPAHRLEQKADKQSLDVRREITQQVLMTLSQRRRHICTLILEGAAQRDVAQEVGVSVTSVQNNWREFKQLCRDKYARRPLPVV